MAKLCCFEKFAFKHDVCFPELSLYHRVPTLNYPEKERFLKTSWKKGKCW